MLKKEEILQVHNSIEQLWGWCGKSRFVGKFAFVAVFVLLVLATTFSTNVSRVYAAAPTICSGHEQNYTVGYGDTLGGIASRYGIRGSFLVSRNSIANSNLIFIGQHLCIPGKVTVSQARATPVKVLAPVQQVSASISGMINHVFGSYAGSAMRIAICESGLNPYATNPTSIGGSHAEGLFQILYPSTWFGTSEANASPYNAYANIKAAHEIFVRDGYSWREWSCR